MDDWRKGSRGRPAAARGGGRRAGGDQPGRELPRARDYGEGVNVVGFDPDTGKMSVTSLPSVHREGVTSSFKTSKPNVDGGVLLGARLAGRLGV